MSNHQIFHDLQQEPSNDPAIIEEQPVYDEENESTQSREEARRSRKREKKFIVRAFTVVGVPHTNPLKHAFRFWSIMGFTSTLMCTWEIALA
jgi:hypothetical protein